KRRGDDARDQEAEPDKAKRMRNDQWKEGVRSTHDAQSRPDVQPRDVGASQKAHQDAEAKQRVAAHGSPPRKYWVSIRDLPPQASLPAEFRAPSFQLSPVAIANALIPPNTTWLTAMIQKRPLSEPCAAEIQYQPVAKTIASRATPAENGQSILPAP